MIFLYIFFTKCLGALLLNRDSNATNSIVEPCKLHLQEKLPPDGRDVTPLYKRSWHTGRFYAKA